jgi:hypothetical protein
MFEKHPNLSDEINNRLAESELLGGAYLSKLQVGAKLFVKTQNSLYEIENCQDGMYIRGNADYCPTPTLCRILGSAWGGSMIKVGFIGRGMHMEFSTAKHRCIVTSEISDVFELQPYPGTNS